MEHEATADRDGDLIVEEATELARRWLIESNRATTSAERRVAERLHGLVEDPDALAFAIRYVDRVARHPDGSLAARELRSLVDEGTLPRFLGPIDRLALRVGALVAPVVPAVVMPIARARMRRLIGHLVVDASTRTLRRHLGAMRAQGFDVNVNLLGEAVLGGGEARRRLVRTLALIEDPSVDYVSVKVSAIADQLDLWNYDDALHRVCEALRVLYRASAAPTPQTFVNLDMEAYHDLALTIDAFTTVLDEPEFAALDAGIVLQAYLPDTLGAMQGLSQWADRRRRRGGAGIKIRLVKGANLAMERVESALSGWDQAPYATKAEVDANYKRCVDWILHDDRNDAVRVGIASHNLFDLAWARLLAQRRGVAAGVDFEMLQGMAPPQARVIGDDVGSLLLYTPIVAAGDFEAAIGYLIRRLEESTAGDNFMRHLFALDPSGCEFAGQAERFRRSVSERADPARRVRQPLPAPTLAQGFANVPNSDPALSSTQAWLADLRARRSEPLNTPLTTSAVDVNAALERSRVAQRGWGSIGASERRSILWRFAEELEARRGDLLVAMADEGVKTFAQADPEVSEAVDFARWYGDRALELDAVPGARFEPLGVVAVVPPWNFPVAIPTGGVCAALAAGNAVVLKPAPQTPRCAEMIVEAAHCAGVPVDAVQLVRTPEDAAGQALVVGADAVILTGSLQTASLFRSWRHDMVLLAETSGKNAIVITPHADVDQAVRDLVNSAFGHAGQKCSAASLAILVGGVAEDDRFRRQLMDATSGLRVGWPFDPAANMGPTIEPVTGPLARALSVLGPGESWFVEPRQLDDSGALWTPGIIEGVTPDSWFARTECFGPVLGLMTAPDLDHAIEIQNDSEFGLTGGIHSLDAAEVETWASRVEVGNAYVNRSTTGAVVGRQPFGGWKASSVGPGAKAGGFDYLFQLGRWSSTTPGGELVARADESDARWLETWYGVDRDWAGLFCEANHLRYRAHPAVVVRAGADADRTSLVRAAAAARRVMPEIVVSSPVEVGIDGVVVEDHAAFERRLVSLRHGRVRMVGSVPTELRATAVRIGIHVIDEPVTSNGRLELRHYLREQTLSVTLHRFGNLTEFADRFSLSRAPVATR